MRPPLRTIVRVSTCLAILALLTAQGAVAQRDVPVPKVEGPTGAAGGDLAGTYPNPSVAKLQGTAVSPTAPTNGQVLGFNGRSWTPAEPPTGGGGTTGQNSISVFGTTGLIVTSFAPTTLPGLTATITVPDNSVTIISTDGGVSVNSTASTGFTSIGIQVLIDGARPPSVAGRLVEAANTNATNATLGGMIANWSLQFSVVLTPGVHSVSVTAKAGAGANTGAIVSGNADSFLQGTLTVTTLKR